MVIIVVVVMMVSCGTDQKRARRKTKTLRFKVSEGTMSFCDVW